MGMDERAACIKQVKHTLPINLKLTNCSMHLQSMHMLSTMEFRVQYHTGMAVAKEEEDILVTHLSNLFPSMPPICIPFPVPRKIDSSGSVKEETHKIKATQPERIT